MPEYSTRFTVPDNQTIELPNELLNQGGWYEIQDNNGDIYVNGNRNGLLYIAEVLIRCATGNYVEGFHVHLPLLSDHASGGAPQQPIDELVIFGASEQRL
jgi:hypothetical protein